MMRASVTGLADNWLASKHHARDESHCWRLHMIISEPATWVIGYLGVGVCLVFGVELWPTLGVLAMCAVVSCCFHLS